VAKRSAGARGKEERPIIRFLWREFNVCVLFVATLALRGCWFFFFLQQQHLPLTTSFLLPSQCPLFRSN
jgi:hypothetical protein